MTLSLTCQQRLNLIALMGAQRLSLQEMRSFWGLQDRFALTDEEKQAIDYRVASTEQGVEIPSWSPAKSQELGEREFEVTGPEALRLRRLIDEWPHFMTGIDRVWLVPLVEQLPEVAQQPQPQAMRM